MKNFFLAAAFTIALPVAAHAQAAPPATPAKECCCKKMGGMDCCAKKNDGSPPADPHAGHDIGKR